MESAMRAGLVDPMATPGDRRMPVRRSVNAATFIITAGKLARGLRISPQAPG